MTEIVTPQRVVHPITGEVLELATANTEDLAELRDSIMGLESQFREAKRAIDAEVLARMDKQASWTLRDGAYKLEGSSPSAKVEYNAAQLREDLLFLVDQKILSIEAVDAAVETIVTYKAHARGINALRKLGGSPATAVAENSREVESVRRVSVSRSWHDRPAVTVTDPETNA